MPSADNKNIEPQRRFVIKEGVRPPVTTQQRIRRRLTDLFDSVKVKANSIGIRSADKVSRAGRLLRNAVSAPFHLLFQRSKGAPGIRFLTVVTLIYLLVEFAFSAWLIDVLSSHASEETIHKAEHYGRLISGFAVALLFWPVLLKARGLSARIGVLAITTYIIMSAVYIGERALIDTLVENSSEEQRAAARTGSLLRAGLASGQIQDSMLEGLWNSETAASTAGKAFVGISAFMAASSESARAQTIAIAPEVIRGVIDNDIGGVDAEYDRFLQSQESIRERFASYQNGHKAYKDAQSKADKEASQAWERYLDSLEARHRYWGRYLIKHKRRDGHLVIEKAQEPTRQAVRKSGIPVPKNWNTGDRATFVKLARQEYLKKAEATFKSRLGKVPPNLNLSQFATNAEVQRAWRESIQYPSSVGPLPISKLSKSQFKARIYGRVLDARTSKTLASYKSKQSDYADGEAKEGEGKQAFEAMIAPVFALTLSLLGALVHVCKSGLLLVQVTTGVHFRSSIVKTAVIVITVLGSMYAASTWVSTTLTSHPTYQKWVKKTPESDSNRIQSIAAAAAGGALDAMIKAQSVAYPAFNIVRKQLDPLMSAEAGRQLESILSASKR